MPRPYPLVLPSLVALLLAADAGARNRDISRHQGLLPKPIPAATAARKPHGLNGLAGAARRSLDVPGGWTGAPALDLITQRPDHVKDLSPLAAAAHAQGPTPAALAVAHLHYGNALTARAYDTAAAAEYLEAVKLDPTLTPAWNNLGALTRQAWDLDVASWIFEAVTRMDPTNGLTRFNLGLIYDLKGQYRKSDAEYLKALELDARLWVPALNPLVVGNERAGAALHHFYLERAGAGGVALDTSTTPAPLVARRGRS